MYKRQIQHSVGITTVYVTHDQEEAMAVSDRIAVMNAGVIQHIGTPKNIYQRPANLFVSTFIGRSNVMNGKLKMEDGKPVLHTTSGYTVALHNVEAEQQKDQDIILSVRPEEFLLCLLYTSHPALRHRGGGGGKPGAVLSGGGPCGPLPLRRL